jgi:hypothetical protein
MQIIRVDVTPVKLSTEQPFRMAGIPQGSLVEAIFARLKTLSFRGIKTRIAIKSTDKGA